MGATFSFVVENPREELQQSGFSLLTRTGPDPLNWVVAQSDSSIFIPLKADVAAGR